MKRDEILKFCGDYLRADTFNDYCINGLQVEGSGEVHKIVTGVSFSLELVSAAIEKDAQMIMVHHGIFKSDVGELPKISGVLRVRLKMLLEYDINLCGFHIPLDVHPEIGNSVSLAKMFGLVNLAGINDPKYGDIGCIGNLEEAINISDFVTMVNKKLNTDAYVITAGPDQVKRVGIVAGVGADDFAVAQSMGADTFLSGAIFEQSVRAVEESGINFINAGHYNTEKLGIQNLGNLIAKEFKIDVEFVDVPCDV